MSTHPSVGPNCRVQPLQDADPRVTVVPMSGHSWDTYTYLEEQGIFNEVEAAPWEEGSSE